MAKDKPSLAMVCLIATQSVCIFPIITVMMPLYVRMVLGLGPNRLGFLMGASAIGSLVGSIFLIGLAREKRVPLMIMFKARSGPTRRGKRWVPPAPGKIPSFTSGNPTCAAASATR